jgi:hypothetical protein
MLGRSRRSRLLAVLLLAASPAAAGTLLPAIHPCPVDSPWLAEREAATHSAGHHGAGHRASPGHQHQVCHCIGNCVAGLAALAPAARGASTAPVAATPVAAWPAHDASLRLAPLAALLPPSTAPPEG